MTGSMVDNASGRRRVKNNCAAWRYVFAICDVWCRDVDSEGAEFASKPEPFRWSSWKLGIVVVAVDMLFVQDMRVAFIQSRLVVWNSQQLALRS